MSNLQYKGYYGVVEFDAEAEIFHGEVIGLTDVITFQSDTAKGVKEEFKASIDDYLEHCAELGREPNKYYNGNISIRATPELHRLIDATARKKGTSMNKYIVRILKDATNQALYMQKS